MTGVQTCALPICIQAKGLQIQLKMMGLDWSLEDCQKVLIDGVLNVFKGVKRYIDTAPQRARDGVVRDVSGMMRYVPGLWSKDEGVRAEARRVVVSHEIQGSAQTMVQRSMIWLKERVWELQDAGVKVDWRLQIHDELIFLVEEEAAEMVKDLVLEGLTEHCGVKLRVPVLAEANVGKTWGELK